MSQKKQGLDRREFLKLSGMLGLSAVAATAPASGVLAFSRNLSKVTRSTRAMSTFVTITVMDKSVSRADDAIGAAFAEMKRVSRLLDRFDSTSPVGVLNREGRVKDLPPETAMVLSQALRFHKLSNGAFDPTVQPVVDLYRVSFLQKGGPPSDKEVDKALAMVDASGLVLSGQTVSLARPGMGVTLDGIAKGFVIDAGANALKKKGITHGLINAGGDIRAIGGKSKGKAWTVAVQNPEGGSYVDKIHMKNGAVATSGNYEVYFDSEKLFHHIINPKTGTSPVRAASVSVRAATVTDADALSTAVFVMGPERGVRFINALPWAECLVISRGMTKSASKGWRLV